METTRLLPGSFFLVGKYAKSWSFKSEAITTSKNIVQKQFAAIMKGYFDVHIGLDNRQGKSKMVIVSNLHKSMLDRRWSIFLFKDCICW